MKKQLTLLACFVFAATATTTAQTQSAAPAVQTRQAELHNWKRYTVAGERFSVSLPTVPAMVSANMLIWELRKSRRERRIGVYADGAVYCVYTYENITRQSLEEFISERNRNNRWDISSETPVAAGAVKGKQYSSRGKPVSETAQFFSAEGRLYEFSITGSVAEDPAAQQFFSSIVLGKKAEGIEVHDGEGRPFSNPSCDQPGPGKEVDRKARVVMKPEPSYTELARQKRVVGTVVLKAIFSCNGSVVDIRAVTDLPHGLTEQAISAARKIKFVPALKGGNYVSMWMQLEYNFNLY